MSDTTADNIKAAIGDILRVADPTSKLVVSAYSHVVRHSKLLQAEWNRNYPAAGEFKKNVILKVSKTHLFQGFPRGGGPMPPPPPPLGFAKRGHTFFKVGGDNAPLGLGGGWAVKYPANQQSI